MCQINNDKCDCNAKEICCKMQKESLRTAISGLKSEQDCRKTILNVLEATYNVLSVYQCIPGTCLLNRIQWVYDNIVPNSDMLSPSERIEINMLTAELETLLDS